MSSSLFKELKYEFYEEKEEIFKFGKKFMRRFIA